MRRVIERCTRIDSKDEAWLTYHGQKDDTSESFGKDPKDDNRILCTSLCPFPFHRSLLSAIKTRVVNNAGRVHSNSVIRFQRNQAV